MKAETQVTLMDDLINQGYSAILLQPADAAALTASVKKAEGKGIPVITLNTDTLLPHAANVTMDDSGSGYLIGEKLGASLGGKGNVAILQSPPGAQAGVEREKGFRAAMGKLYPNIKIVGAQNAMWVKDKGIEIMNSFMQVHKDLDAVFAVNDNMAEGAMIAAESAGRLGQIKIWGFNGQKSTLALIEQGKITGTAYTNALQPGSDGGQIRARPAERDEEERGQDRSDRGTAVCCDQGHGRPDQGRRPLVRRADLTRRRNRGGCVTSCSTCNLDPEPRT